MNHDRALSFIVPSTSNNSAAEKNGQQQQQKQPSLDTKGQLVIPSEANTTSSSSDSQGPPTPIPATLIPSMSMTNISVTKIETGPKPPSLTLNISPTVTLLTNSRHSPTILTNPHHSPTTTVLTNPQYSPTQSVFTNPHHGSDSPTTIHSSLPLRDLDNISSSANSSSPIPQAGSVTAVPSPAKSEAARSQTGFLRSALRSSLDEVQNSSTTNPVSSSLAVNSTQAFSNVLLENTHTKTQDIVANQSVNDQHQTTLSKYHNGSPPTPTASSQEPSTESQHDDRDHINALSNPARALYRVQQSETPSTIDTEDDALGRQSTLRQNPWEKASVNKDEAETSGSSQSQAKNTRGSSPVVAVKPTGDVALDSSMQRNDTTATTTSWKSSATPSASSRTVGRLSPTRSGLGRKPSGARAQLAPRSYNRNGPGSFSSQTLTEEDESMPESQKQESQTALAYDDANAEVLAALTYLDITDEDVSASATPLSPLQHRSPIITSPSAESSRLKLSDRLNPPTMLNPDSVPFRSSFAPSSKVAERILKAQAQQAAHDAAKHRPGRANGKKGKTAAETWESSEEEEEDDDEEDEDVDSDLEVPMMRGPQSGSSRFSSSSSARPPQSSDSNGDGPPSHLRPPRHLPPVPPGRAGKYHDSVHCVYYSNPQTHCFYLRGRALSAANSPDDSRSSTTAATATVRGTLQADIP